MLTRCPFCQTVFQVTDEQLASAHGLARCGQCQEVFDAAENVCEEDHTPILADRDAVSSEHEYDWRPADSSESAEQESSKETEASSQADWVDNHDDFLIPAEPDEAKTEPEPEPEHVIINSPAIADDDTATVRMSLDKDSTEISEVPLEIRDDVVARKHGPDRSYGRWLAGSLLLVLVLAVQFIWFQRDELASRYPETRSWLQSFCKLTGCTLTPVAAPDKIRIISRELRFQTGKPGTIRVEMTIANIAEHDQPWPVIQLVLSNSTTGFRAMRRLTADEYLPGTKRPAVFAVDTPVNLSFEIIKPGKYTPDYVFSFLKPPAQ